MHILCILHYHHQALWKPQLPICLSKLFLWFQISTVWWDEHCFQRDFVFGWSAVQNTYFLKQFCTYFWIVLLFYYIKTASLDICDLTFIVHPQQILFLHTRAHCACTCDICIMGSTFSTTGSDIITNVVANSATVLFYACALHYLTNHNIFCHSVLLSAVFFVFWFSTYIHFKTQISSLDMMYMYYLTRDSQTVRIASYFLLHAIDKLDIWKF